MATQTHGTKQPDFKALIEAELGITISSLVKKSNDVGGICEFHIILPTITAAQWTSLKTWRDLNWTGLHLQADVV